MASGDVQKQLQELEQLATQLGVRVCYDAMTGLSQGSGGLCKVRGEWRIIMDRRLKAVERLLTKRGGDAVAAMIDERAFLGLAHRALAFGVAVAVRDQFIAARREGLDHLGAVVVQRCVDQCRRWQAQAVEQFKAAPGSDAVAVFSPAVVQYIRLRATWAYACAHAFAKGEVLDIETDVNRQTSAVSPNIVRPLCDRAVGKAAAVRQGNIQTHGNSCIGDAQGSTRPARTRSHSALSFHTSILTIRPCLTTYRSTYRLPSNGVPSSHAPNRVPML